MIYNMAREKINIPAERCIVIEDSIVGLKAAKGAGMKCIITYTSSTEKEDFYGIGADAKVPDLRDVTFDDIFGPLFNGQSSEILSAKRDLKTVISFTATASTTTTTTANPVDNSVLTSTASVEVIEEVVKPVEVVRVSGWTPHYITIRDA